MIPSSAQPAPTDQTKKVETPGNNNKQPEITAGAKHADEKTQPDAAPLPAAHAKS